MDDLVDELDTSPRLREAFAEVLRLRAELADVKERWRIERITMTAQAGHIEQLLAEKDGIYKEVNITIADLTEQLQATRAELAAAHTAIFPYVSDLDEPLAVLVGGLGARYDLRGKVISELRAELADRDRAIEAAVALKEFEDLHHGDELSDEIRSGAADLLERLMEATRALSAPPSDAEPVGTTKSEECPTCHGFKRFGKWDEKRGLIATADCPTCGGSGLPEVASTAVDEDGNPYPAPCPTCGGSGYRMTDDPRMDEECPTCRDMPWVPELPGAICPTCKSRALRSGRKG